MEGVLPPTFRQERIHRIVELVFQPVPAFVFSPIAGRVLYGGERQLPRFEQALRANKLVPLPLEGNVHVRGFNVLAVQEQAQIVVVNQPEGRRDAGTDGPHEQAA